MWLTRVPILTGVGRVLIEDDGPQKAQAIVVLGGDNFGTRIIKAAQLVEEGYAPYVLVSGPPQLLGYEADMTIEFARQKGYQASLFKPLRLNVNSTRTETAAIGKYLREHGIHKIDLVTSNYHTRRAAKLMRKQNSDIQAIAVAAPDPFFTQDGWWKTRNGLKTFFDECLKTVAVDLGV